MREHVMRQPGSHSRIPPNPSDDYPPTRPGVLIVALALLAIVAGLGIENWSDISHQVPRIEAALGL
jgi:hypothetical protein